MQSDRLNLVQSRIDVLAAFAERPPTAVLLDGIAATSGLGQASVERLTELWLESLRGGAIVRWTERMGTGRMAAGRLQPVREVGIVAPGNLFVATWTAMLEPWLCGCSVQVRPGSGDPRSAANLVDALGADGFALVNFARGDTECWHEWLRELGALAVYGGDEAVAAVRDLAVDAGMAGPIRGHGHRVSIARIGAAELQGHAREIAHDALVGDGRGCMSLRSVLVTGAASLDASELAASWLATFAQVAGELPAGRLDNSVLAVRRMMIEQARVDGALGEPVQVFEFDDAVVIVDGRLRDAVGLRAIGPGARLLVILADAPLEDELSARLAMAPVNAAGLGAMQQPSVWRDPDGYPVGRVFVSDPSSA